MGTVGDDYNQKINSLKTIWDISEHPRSGTSLIFSASRQSDLSHYLVDSWNKRSIAWWPCNSITTRKTTWCNRIMSRRAIAMPKKRSWHPLLISPDHRQVFPRPRTMRRRRTNFRRPDPRRTWINRLVIPAMFPRIRTNRKIFVRYVSLRIRTSIVASVCQDAVDLEVYPLMFSGQTNSTGRAEYSGSSRCHSLSDVCCASTTASDVPSVAAAATATSATPSVASTSQFLTSTAYLSILRKHFAASSTATSTATTAIQSSRFNRRRLSISPLTRVAKWVCISSSPSFPYFLIDLLIE